MINEVMIVGIFHDEKGFIKINGRNYLQISIEVEKAFINSEGNYEKDYVDCLLWKGEADYLLEFKKECRWLSVNGRLERHEDKMYVFAEKIKYLDGMINS